MLALKNISKNFDHKKIVDNVSVDFKQGEIAIFLGASGVGKSTLLRIMNNLEVIDSGSIEYEGKSTDTQTLHKQRVVGMVFQHFNLFDHMTALDNIVLPLVLTLKKNHDEAVNEAQLLLVRYGLSSHALSYPSELSGGQKQRLAIARAIALKPRIICMDEPTSALDPAHTRSVAHSVAQLAAEGYTVIIATHDTQLLTMLQCTIYLMEHGTIVESCTSHDIFNEELKSSKIKSFVAGL